MEQKGSDKMKQNTKTLWIYTMILFSVALVLIMMAGLTQQNYEEEIKLHETAAVGMQKSVSELSEKNMKLGEENKKLTESLKQTESDKEKAEQSAGTYETLIDALKEYEKGNRKTARQMLAEIEKSQLSSQQLYIYQKIMK